MNNNYKSVARYLEKNKNKQSINVGGFVKVLVSKVLVCILLLTTGLIILKYDKNNSQKIYKFIYETNFSFASVNDFFKTNFGDVLPFQNITENNTTSVFNEDLVYNNLSIYKNGIALTVSENYLVPSTTEGVVIFIGEKEDFKNTIIIQTKDGVNVWYGNITGSNVNLYDYVEKSDILGMTSGNTLYLAFEKDGEFVDYKNYF